MAKIVFEKGDVIQIDDKLVYTRFGICLSGDLCIVFLSSGDIAHNDDGSVIPIPDEALPIDLEHSVPDIFKQVFRAIRNAIEPMSVLSDVPSLEKGIDNPKDTGRESHVFLKSDVPTSALDPVDFLGDGSFIVEEDERSSKLCEVDPTKVSLISLKAVFAGHESPVTYEKMLQCLKILGHIRLDVKFWQTFRENQELIPEKYKELINGTAPVILFPGTIFQKSCGSRYILCLSWSGGECRRSYVWLGHECDPHDLFAVLVS